MWKDLFEKVIILIGKVKWKLKTPMTDQDKQQIRQLLGPNHYVIVTRRKNHLSTYFINLADFLLSGKWGYYSHTLINIEDDVKSDEDFRLIEAIGKGVVITPFDKVFNCSSVAILKPRGMTAEKWTNVFEKAKSQLGKPYDNLLDLYEDSELNCVELVRNALMTEPNYHNDFAHFEKMIAKHGRLTPQMFYNCPDFEIVWESKH